MAVTVVFYNVYKKNSLSSFIDEVTVAGTVKVALTTSTYTPDIDAHLDFADITNEITSDNYTAGGVDLANGTVTQDDTDDEGVYDADDATWGTLTATPRYAILYKNSGTAASSPLMAYVNFGQDEALTADDLTLVWNAEGIINVG